MNTVLIVEDEIIEQDFLKSLTIDHLSSEDTVLTCGNGTEAIRLAKKFSPNLIFMDIMLPETDGLSAIKEIRTFLPNSCITILSASSDFSYAQKAVSLRVFEYLLKPIRPSKFQEILDLMLESTVNCKSIAQTRLTNDKIDNIDCQNDFINESIDYINKNFKEKLSLDLVSSKVFMNPKYFSKVFKEQTGVSFSIYINNLKIKHACRLLETTNYPAYRISMECGFSDPSYFNRVFSSTMDMTPLNYRKQYLSSTKKI